MDRGALLAKALKHPRGHEGSPAADSATDNDKDAATAQDLATKKIESILALPAPPVELDSTTKPKKLPASSDVEQPRLPQTMYQGVPPRPGLEPGGKVRPPKHPADDTPLASNRTQPEKPGAVNLPAGALVKVPGVDVNEPIPLPILAQPQKDRASLADPSFSSSLEVTLAQRIPLRDQAAPFQAVNLPDPFAHAYAARLRTPLGDDPLPFIPWPRRP